MYRQKHDIDITHNPADAKCKLEKRLESAKKELELWNNKPIDQENEFLVGSKQCMYRSKIKFINTKLKEADNLLQEQEANNLLQERPATPPPPSSAKPK